MARWHNGCYSLTYQIRPLPLKRNHLLEVIFSNTPQLEANVLSTVSSLQRESDRIEQNSTKQRLLTKFKNKFLSPKILHHRKQQFYLSMIPFENAGESLGQQGICLCDSPGPKERRWIFSKVLKKRCNRRKTSPHCKLLLQCNLFLCQLTDKLKRGFSAAGLVFGLNKK